jgi:hypothetical protein
MSAFSQKRTFVMAAPPASARTLRSDAEVQEAPQNGEFAIKEPSVVVNLPMLMWPVGQQPG